MRQFLRVLLVLIAALVPSPVLAAFGEPLTPTLSAYGGVGLLDMRTARFLSDGFLAPSVSVKHPDDRIALTFQALPWVETTFRYSINYEVKLGGFTDEYYDRSFDVKFLLLSEREFWPQLALGFQDVVGTGVYSAEYLVASKLLGPFDFSAGLGWGRLASRGTLRNPFIIFGDRFETRQGVSGEAGAPLFGSFFRGPDMGVFGGVEYTTPIDNLKLQLEYSSDSYELESVTSGKDFGFPLNVGVSYRAFRWLDVGLSYMHGRHVGLRVSSYIDLAGANWPVRLDPPPRFRGRPDEVVRALQRRRFENEGQIGDAGTGRYVDLTADSQGQAQPGDSPIGGIPALDGQSADLTPLTVAAMATQGLTVHGVERTERRLKVAVENNRYRRDAEAIARAARVLSGLAPVEIEEFEITVLREGVSLTTALMLRTEIDDIARRQGSPAELWTVSEFSPAVSPSYLSNDIYPRLSGDIHPFFRQSLFDPNNPLYVQFGLGASAGIELARGLSVGGNVYASFVDNFGSLDRPSDSVLPHVRTDAPLYLREGKYALNSLTAAYLFKLAPEIYGRVSAGYLEWMFAGAGGELLYRPFGQRWALGADLWAVQQRDYDQWFRLRPLKTVTGHISAYYELPYYDIKLGLHGGRYLAGDYGATFEATRHFATGVQVGAWFTLTDVSAEEFGEGSFDKGIRLVIPFEWVAPFASQSRYQLDLRPVQRDGGQMLLGAKRLYPMTDEADFGSLSRDWISAFGP